MAGGSSEDKLTIIKSLAVHCSPVTGLPLLSCTISVRDCPIERFTLVGKTVYEIGTVKLALLLIPLSFTTATGTVLPGEVAAGTIRLTLVSLQFNTWAIIPPNNT
jgi:hypothetical protein